MVEPSRIRRMNSEVAKRRSTPTAAYFLCPLTATGCSWCGRKPDVLAHFESCHANNLTYTGEINIDLSRTNSSRYTLMRYLDRVYLIYTSFDASDGNAQKNHNPQNADLAGRTCGNPRKSGDPSKCGHLTVKLRLLGTQEEAAAHGYYVELVCGTFSFNCRNSPHAIATNATDGTILIDLDAIAMLTSLEKSIKLYVIFDRLPKNDLYVGLSGADDDDVAANRRDDGETESHWRRLTGDGDDGDVVETKNETIVQSGDRIETIAEEEDTDIESDSSCTLRRRSSVRRFSSTSRRRSSTTDALASFDVDDDRRRDTDTRLSSLICDFCRAYAKPPVYRCQTIHVACVLCKTNRCTRCTTEIRRDATLDELCKAVAYPCRFERCGERSLSFDDVHEVTCVRAAYECPLNDGYSGHFYVFVDHAATVHRAIPRYDKLTNPFPEDTTFFVVNDRCGIFLCSSLLHNAVVEYNVTFCGTHRAFVECVVVFMGKTEHKYGLCRVRWDKFTTSISTRELRAKGLKARNALLVINTTPTKLFMER